MNPAREIRKLGGLRRSKARTVAQNRVFARADEAARAHSSLACCHLSARFFIRFKEPKLFYFTHPPHPEIAKGSMMRTTCPTRVSSLREGPPTRRDLASDTFTPSFSIEKHFVLQPTLCAPIFHIHLTFFDFEYTQDLSLPNLSLPRSTHMDYRSFFPCHAPAPRFFLVSSPAWHHVSPRRAKQ